MAVVRADVGLSSERAKHKRALRETVSALITSLKYDLSASTTSVIVAVSRYTVRR